MDRQYHEIRHKTIRSKMSKQINTTSQNTKQNSISTL